MKKTIKCIKHTTLKLCKCLSKYTNIVCSDISLMNLCYYIYTYSTVSQPLADIFVKHRPSENPNQGCSPTDRPPKTQ